MLVRPEDVSIAPVGAPSDDLVGSVVTRTFAGRPRSSTSGSTSSTR
jgi:hypothetical protein